MPAALIKLAESLKRNPKLAITPETILVDVGSGMGRAMMTFATYGVKVSLGIEIDPALSHISNLAINKVKSKLDDVSLGSAVCIQSDVTKVQDIEPGTMVFTFSGVYYLLAAAVRLAALSLTCTVFICIVTKRKWIKECGLVNDALGLGWNGVIIEGGKL